MPSETVRVEAEGPVGIVVLDRAESGNAVDQRMAFDLTDACDRLEQDERVRVVILTGVGDMFCRGTEASGPEGSGDGLDMLRRLKIADRVAAIGKPVIAALNGDAIDQGLELGLACDIRIASEGARLGLTHVENGLIPWDGGTQRLPRLIGRGVAMEMVLTSRLVDAREALEIGLVNQVVDADHVLQRAREVAAGIAAHAPVAARYLKEAVLKGLDMTLDQGLRLEADLNVILQGTSDRAEGISSFLERRPPDYTGR